MLRLGVSERASLTAGAHFERCRQQYYLHTRSLAPVYSGVRAREYNDRFNVSIWSGSDLLRPGYATLSGSPVGLINSGPWFFTLPMAGPTGQAIILAESNGTKRRSN